MTALGPKTPSSLAAPCLCHCLLAAVLGVQLAPRLGVPDAGLHTWGTPGRVLRANSGGQTWGQKRGQVGTMRTRGCGRERER